GGREGVERARLEEDRCLLHSHDTFQRRFRWVRFACWQNGCGQLALRDRRDVESRPGGVRHESDFPGTYPRSSVGLGGRAIWLAGLSHSARLRASRLSLRLAHWSRHIRRSRFSEPHGKRLRLAEFSAGADAFAFRTHYGNARNGRQNLTRTRRRNRMARISRAEAVEGRQLSRSRVNQRSDVGPLSLSGPDFR